MRRAPCSRNQRGMTAPWVTTVDATAEGLGAWLERLGQRRVLRREPGPPRPARAPRPTRGGSSGSRRSAARRGPLPDSGRCPRPRPAPLGRRGPPRGPPEGCIAWRGLEGAHPLEGGAWPCGPRMRRLSSDAPWLSRVTELSLVVVIEHSLPVPCMGGYARASAPGRRRALIFSLSRSLWPRMLTVMP